MSITKHKLFQVPIVDETGIPETGFEEMNSFLSNPNYVYSGHSVSIMTQSIKVTNHYRLVNKFVLLSLVYKDLSETSLNLKNVSKKAATVVKTSIEENDLMPKPSYETHFEKNTKKQK